MSGRPVLVADIGATNARFALARGARLDQVVVLSTGDYASATALLAEVRSRLGFDELAGCCLGMAGPVQHGRGRITNGLLELTEREVAAVLGCEALLVNDFYALARSVPILARLRQLGGEAGASGPKALIGPGSGLGMSILVPRGQGWIVLPSEGGHADLAPGNPLETELLQVLQRSGHAVCWESVLSGPGLVILYGAVRAVWGFAPDLHSQQADGPVEVTPEWVTRQGLHADDPICSQTLEIFFGLLGSAAGNLALTLCATGGVYIGGGIVPQLVEFAVASPFRRRFDERAGLADFVAAIPVYIILDEQPGLLGALECLR